MPVICRYCQNPSLLEVLCLCNAKGQQESCQVLRAVASAILPFTGLFRTIPSRSDSDAPKEPFAMLGVGLVEPDRHTDAACERPPFLLRPPRARWHLLRFRGHANLPFIEGTL